ncbi:MAG: zf-HC2 domain-containing protein [Gemmatimonadales bacterium]
MSDEWTDRLSEYLDDDLSPEERIALESHLRHCVACGAVLADLKRIVARAGALETRAPDRDLWPGIAARIGASAGAAHPGRRADHGARQWSFSLAQLAAAGIVLAALAGGAAWILHPAGGPRVAIGPAPATVSVPLVRSASTGRMAGPRGYDTAVSDLERALDAGRGRLDTTTVRVIERNLAIIDSAIAQAQRAVAVDSASLYLNSHLADTMRRKLELLRRAADLAAAVS